MLDNWYISTAVVFLFYQVFANIFGFIDQSPYNYIPNLIAFVICAVPASVMLHLGRKKVFRFLARNFVYGVEARMRDGSLLAELVLFVPIDTGGWTWIYRREPSTAFEELIQSGWIQRRLWILAKEPTGNPGVLHINLAAEFDMEWCCSIVGGEEVFPKSNFDFNRTAISSE